MSGLKDQILSRRDLQPVPVKVPGWPAGTYVRLMTGRERDRAAQVCESDRPDTEKMAFVIATCLCDPHGVNLFDPDNREDIEALMDVPFQSLKVLWDAIVAHNGLDQSQEQLAKN